MRINTNIASMNAQQISNNTNKEIGSSLEKLASGHSINKASDDASGLAIADKLRTQASSLNQGIKNANSGVAMIQMADKAMEEQSNILDTIKTKLIQASDATTTADGRAAIQNDISKLLEQFDNISSQTDYNGKTLLDGSKISFQVGEKAGETISLNASSAINTSSLGETIDKTGTASKTTTGDFTTLTAGTNSSISIGDTEFSVNYDEKVNGINVKTDAEVAAALAFKINASDLNVSAAVDAKTIKITANEIGPDNLDTVKTRVADGGEATPTIVNGTDTTGNDAEAETDAFTLTKGAAAGDSITATINGKDFTITNGDTVNGNEVTTLATMTDAMAFKINSDSSIGTTVESDGVSALTFTSTEVGVDTQDITIKQNNTDLAVTTHAAGIDGTNGGLEELMNKDTLSASDASKFLKTIDTALTQLNENRSEFGSTQVQLESAVRNSQVTVVSLAQAESVIRDTDYAAESANFNKLNIVSQAGMYAISQANSSQQNIMKLLQ
jgi:flagellin